MLISNERVEEGEEALAKVGELKTLYMLFSVRVCVCVPKPLPWSPHRYTTSMCRLQRHCNVVKEYNDYKN